jgi:SAM-dependent methyltransferase
MRIVFGGGGETDDDRPPLNEPQTWHYGVVAKWWAEFNTSGPEIAYFQRFVEAGQPALDVACGTGRLLIPYLHAGLDVDGCDISADMIALCRERAEQEGLSPTLRVQAMHQLDMKRTYRTIYICGGFGLGGSRDHDEEALRRIDEHLEPGGTLVLDNEVYSSDVWGWRRRDPPEPWPETGDRRTGSDGTEYELRGRIVDVDPLGQQVTSEIRGSMWREGRLVEQDQHVLKMTVYFANELHLMLERAGFSDIQVRGDYTDEAPTGDTEFVVFIARKPHGRTSGTVPGAQGALEIAIKAATT